MVVVHGLGLIRMSFFEALFLSPSSSEEERSGAVHEPLQCDSAPLPRFDSLFSERESRPAIPQQRRQARAEDRRGQSRRAGTCKWNLDKYKGAFCNV